MTSSNLYVKAACALALAAFSSASAADDHRSLDIASDLPGMWGQDRDLTPAGNQRPGSADCETNPLRIWLSEDGQRYNSQYDGSSFIGTSRIHEYLPSSAASAGIVISYDNVSQPDRNGVQLRWHLVMVDAYRFNWIREDSDGNTSFYSAMTRCPDDLFS